MDDNKILYSKHEGVHFLRFQGDILHTLAPALDRFLRHLALVQESCSYLLDLTETQSIDSTMLGLLARVAKLAREREVPPPTLVCPNEDIVDLLMGIGFDEVFSLVACDGAPLEDGQEIKEISQPETDNRLLTQTMLDAHQELIALKEDNRLLFEDVIELLRRNLDDQGP
jgi:anti-anti-sigma factor